jgi:hypothetical protein
MSEYVWKEPKRFAVICSRWKDNGKDREVLEYFQTTDECKAYIAAQDKSVECDYEIAKYE